MRNGFVLTANYRLLMATDEAVRKRGAREAGLVIIHGPYGVGKSEICERWATDNGPVFVRALETWTKRSLLDALAGQLNADRNGRNSEVQARIIGALAVSGSSIVIDEADHLIRSTAGLLEVVRDITDMTGCACFLIAMDARTGQRSFTASVARYGHIASRVARVVTFQPLPLSDVKATCDKKSEVAIADDLVARIHADSEGRMRLVLNAIANIEHWADTNGWTPPITATMVRGMPLVAEFRARADNQGRGTAMPGKGPTL